MKKTTFLLLLFVPFIAGAQMASLGLAAGPAFFSQLNTLPALPFPDKINTSVYSAIHLKVTAGDRWEISLVQSINSVQTNYKANSKLILLYADNLGQSSLRVNRYLNKENTQLYFGVNTGFCTYSNPDSTLLAGTQPNKVSLTDKGSGFIAGVQLGIKAPVSARLFVTGEIAFQHFGIGSSKKFYSGWAALNYSYGMYPLTLGLHYELSARKQGEEKREKKSRRTEKPVSKDDWKRS